MLKKLKSLLESPGAAAPGKHERDELQLAAACLLAEAANLDDDFTLEEESVIRRLLAERFGLDAGEAEELLREARAEIESKHELYGFTRTVKDRFDHAERIELLEMLWEVVYADGELHDHEANLMRRVTGLLYLEDRESGLARRRVLERLS